MSKYKIIEVRKTLVNGEVESVFYIYKPFLFFWREEDELNSAEKVKKTETIIHTL